jgi:hypothetical protein
MGGGESQQGRKGALEKAGNGREEISRLLPLSLSSLLGCWLLAALSAHAVEWQSGPGHRSAAVAVPSGGQPGFTLMSSSLTGVLFTNVLPESRHLTNQVLLNGSGVAAGDVDGDGWCDLYFCGVDRPNALFRNLGNWKFSNITAQAGVACAGLTASGCALVDLDGDGDLDLIVNTVGHGTHVFFNDGRAHFTEMAVLNNGKAGMSLALGDLDGDGFLDLYIANYRTMALMDMPSTHFAFSVVNGQRFLVRVNGRPVTDPEYAHRYRVNAKGSVEEDGEADEIYRNLGGRTFAPLPFTGGTFLDEDGRALPLPPFDWGLSVMIRDLNQDGLPDIWVCNDFDSPERIWLNQGGGKFRAAPRLAFRKSSHFSMGIDVADINRDGFDDVFVVDMLSRDHVMRMDMMGDRNPPVPVAGVFDNRPEHMVNTLFLNRGDGTYAEMAQLAGLHATEWSWTPLFLDVDLDGWEDVLVANGHERAARSLDVSEKLRALRTERQLTREEIFQNRRLFPRQNAPNLAFRNRGDLTFEDTSREWGFNFNGVSHGMCLADLDNDGDLDVAVNNLNDPGLVYRNNASAPRLAVRLKGAPPNTRGIGGRIQVRGGAVPIQTQEIICGGRYLSSDDAIRTFAAGTTTNVMTIEVAWRSGKRSVLPGAKANRIYEIDEAFATNSPRSVVPEVTRLPTHFTDVSSMLGHRHKEERWNDFDRQPLLPNQLSQLGPGVTWCDLDGDGWDDLVIGEGKGGHLGVYRNNGQGGFQRLTTEPFHQRATRDQATVLFVHKQSGEAVLLAGSSNYEDGLTNGAVAREFNLTKRVVAETLPGQASSTGPMAMADMDGDGQLDLFVGGRVMAGHWPEAASSMVFRGAGDNWTPDAENTKTLAQVGMVSGAVFSDLDGDGDPDLVLACEWGPLRIFRNTQGRLQPWDPIIAGWDGEGSPAGQQAGKPAGQSSPPPAFSPAGLQPFFPRALSQLTGWWNGVTVGDFDGDGRMDIAASNWGRNTPFQSHRTQPLQLLYGDFNGDGVAEAIEAYSDPGLKKDVTERQLDFLGKAMPILRARFTSHLVFGRASVQEVLGDQWNATRRLEATWLESTVFLNRGDRFEAHVLPVEAQMAPAFAVCAGDLDGDGHEDLLLSQNFFAVQPETPRYDAGRGLWLRGDGRGGFTAVPGQESGILVYGEQRGAALGDFDRDGRIDVALSQNSAETKLYRNAGAKPGLRVHLAGPAGNPEAVGAALRLRSGAVSGPAREIHAGSGYWSQDSAVQVLALPEGPAKLWIRWPGGMGTNEVEVPVGAREIRVEPSGKLMVVPRSN